MRVDRERLDREIYKLKEAAKRKCDFTDIDLADYLTISVSTLRNKSSQHKLYTLSALDIAVLESLAGERLEAV